jgi:hypothetical protein
VRPPEPRFTIFDLLFARSGLDALERITRPLEEVRAPRLKFVVPW